MAQTITEPARHADAAPRAVILIAASHAAARRAAARRAAARRAAARRAAARRAAARRAAAPLALLAALGVCGWPASAALADEVYKSIDAQGHVVYSDRPDAAGPNARRVDDARIPPPEMHFCWTNCFTLILDHGLYRRADGSDETWTIGSFTPESVVLHRHDAPAAWNGFHDDVAYQGRVSDDRLVNILVDGKPVSGVNASWGVALDTLPGSNSERDRRLLAQSGAALAEEASFGDAASLGDGEPPMDESISTADAPPPLPDEDQPPCIDDGYLWTPGYWGWGGGRYYWVHGLWTQPPRAGVLWTPGYWQFAGGTYLFHRGYWGPHVGYYGGINYGFGYGGVGFSGGRWVGEAFAYNRAVSNVNASVVRNTYHESVAASANLNRVSYNGGAGGTRAAPTAEERAAAAEPHIAPTPLQRQYALHPGGSPVLAARTSGTYSVVSSMSASAHAPAVSGAQSAVRTHAGAPAVGAAPGVRMARPAAAAPAARVEPAAARGEPAQPPPRAAPKAAGTATGARPARVPSPQR